MKRKASALLLSLALLFSMGAMTLQTGYCMPLSPDVHVYGDTTVYDIGGRDVNVTITLDMPENKAYNGTLAFTLEAPASILAPAGNTVNSSQYLVKPSQNLFDCYLCSGFILDYDRARVIDTLWINWGNSVNETHINEYNSLLLYSYDAVLSQSGDTYYGSAVLTELLEGAHNLTVWVRAEQNYLSTDIPFWAAFSKTINFTVDTVAPSVLVLSPESNVYKTSSVPLNFTVNEPFSKVTYSLDGQENVTVSGNTTLTGLPNGDHNVTVYATDKAGNVDASQTISFSVEIPFPTTLVAVASAVSVSVVGLGFLFYFKRSRTKNNRADNK